MRRDPWLRDLGVALRRLMTTDRVAQVATASLVGVFVLHAAGVAPWLTQPVVTHPLFGLLTLWAIRRDRRSLRGGAERGFWRDAETATLAGLVTSVAMPLWEVLHSAALWGVGLLGLVASYAFLLLAVERRPHEQAWWRSSELERRLTLPAVLIFVLGIVVYVALLPILASGRLEDGLTETLQLVTVLTLLVTVRFGWQAGAARGDSRWRSIYFLFAVSLAILLVFHAARIGVFGLETAMQEPRLALWVVPPWLLVLAARIRHAPFPPPSAGTGDELLLPLRAPGLTTRTMLLALFPPLIHFAAVRVDLVGTDLREERELWVLLWIVGLAVVATVQSHQLSRRLREMTFERRRIEQILAQNEHRLRVADTRRAAGRTLAETRDLLRKAFRRSPYGMTISTLDDGRHLEVNEKYLRSIGYARDEVIGRTSAELGLWTDPDARRRLVRRVEAGRPLREVDIVYRDREGRYRQAIASMAVLDVGGRDCLLAVIRATDEARGPDGVRRRAEALSGLEGPVAVTDADGTIVWWSPGRLGRSTTDARGRPLDEVVRCAVEGETSRGEIVSARVDVEIWTATLRDRRGRRTGTLVITSPAGRFTGV